MPTLDRDGVKIYYRHYPPVSGEGIAFLDDLNLINWQDLEFDNDNSAQMAGPNDWRFLRCMAPEDGTMQLTLTRSTYRMR